MLIATAILAAAVPATLPLQPNGPWIVREEENICLLERNYPVGNDRVSLIFQPLLDLPAMELFVVNDDRNGGKQFAGEFSATFDPQPQKYTGRYSSLVTARTKVRVTRLSIGRVALDQARDGDTLAVKAKPIDLRFVIRRPDQAKVALKTCVDKLKKAWGIDPDEAIKTATELQGSPAAYFSAGDYPKEALAKGVYGRVVALLNIDATGTVSACRVLSSAGALLNAGTCRQAMKVRFKPARDKDGKALPSTYILPVRWVLPGTE